MAVNSLFSAMDVANGDLEWKHAAVQMGVSAVAGGATSALGSYAGQAVNMAASGIDYEEGGSIGWSNDNFKSGVKSGLVNMAISATGNSFNKGMNGTGYERVGTGLNSGVSSFVNSGLDVDNGSWWRIGWKEEGTMDHVMAGLASATASAATYSKTGQNPSKNTKGETTYDKYNYDGDFSQEGYNNKLLYNTINSGMMSLYNMAAHDLSWEDASKQNGFYSGMLYDHKDIGGRLGKFVASGFDPDFDRKKPASQGSENDNPDRDAESLVGALWQGLKQIGDDFTGAMESISNGLGGHGFRSDREIQMASLRASQVEYILNEANSIKDDFYNDVKSVTESRKKNLYANIEAAGLTDQFSGMMDNLDSQIMTMRRADQIAKAMKAQQEAARNRPTVAPVVPEGDLPEPEGEGFGQSAGYTGYYGNLPTEIATKPQESTFVKVLSAITGQNSKVVESGLNTINSVNEKVQEYNRAVGQSVVDFLFSKNEPIKVDNSLETIFKRAYNLDFGQDYRNISNQLYNNGQNLSGFYYSTLGALETIVDFGLAYVSAATTEVAVSAISVKATEASGAIGGFVMGVYDKVRSLTTVTPDKFKNVKYIHDATKNKGYYEIAQSQQRLYRTTSNLRNIMAGTNDKLTRLMSANDLVQKGIDPYKNLTNLNNILKGSVDKMTPGIPQPNNLYHSVGVIGIWVVEGYYKSYLDSLNAMREREIKKKQKKDKK